MEERIRVAVRIRPENVDKVSVCQSDVDKNVITINSESANNKSDEHSFKFDRVYNKESNQEAIFEDVKGLVMSSLDGYNATIFAFGMTGSGKTHTISGNSKDPGIVPRSIELIFSEIEKRSLINPTEICIPYLSCIELYNNVLYDLLEKPIAFSNNINTSTSASGFSGNYKQSVLKLFEHPIKGVTVTGTKTIRTPVTCAKEAMELIQMANNRRSVDCTNCNDRSSRSHCVYKLEFLCHEKKHSVNVDTGGNSDSNEKVNRENEVDSGLNADDAFNEAVCVFGTDSHTLIKHSCINFVDLAGSENVKVSGATGGTLEEAKQINKALAILGDVLNALSRNSLSAKAVNTSVSSSVDSAVASKYNRPTTTFIPYRSSKLTMLLKDSLGGNSKTMMIATIRPTMRDYYQSLTTLRYAARTRDITCTPRLNVTIHTDSKMVPRNEKNKEQEKHMQAILDEVALLKSNLAAQQIEYDSLQQQKEELNKLVNSFRQNENHDGNKQQLDLELLFEKNELETMKLKEKLQNIIEIQDMKLIEQAKEYQTNLALERKHVSKTMLELTKEKANIQSELSNTNKYVIPDLLSKIEDLEKRNIDLNNQNSELQIEMKQVLENCGEEQKMWEEYALIGYEKEKSEFLAMLDKVNASRNKYKGIASQLEKELQTKDQLLYEYQTKLQEQTIRKVVTVGINTEQKKDPYVNIIDKNIDVTQWDEYEQLKNELQLKNDRILTLESQLDSSLSLNKLFEDSSTNQSTEHMLELESLNKTLKQDLAASRGKESKLENLVRKLSVNMEKLKAEIFHDHDNLSKLQEDCMIKDDQIALLRCENEKIDTKYHEYVKLSKNELEDLNSKILEINRKNADSKTQMQLDFDKQINGKHACIDHLKQDLIILENKYKKIEFEFSSYRESNEVCMEKICRTISGECAFVLNDCISRIIEDSDRRKSGSWDINDDVVGLVEEVHPLKCPSTEKGDSLRDDEIISEPGLGVDIGVQIDIDKDANVALFADRDVGVGYLSSPVSSSESQQRRIETLEAKICQLMLENEDLETRMEQKTRLLATEQQLSSHYLEHLERTRRMNSCDLSQTMQHLQTYIEGEQDAKNAKKILYRSMKATRYRKKLGLDKEHEFDTNRGSDSLDAHWSGSDKGKCSDSEKENRLKSSLSLNVLKDTSKLSHDGGNVTEIRRSRGKHSPIKLRQSDVSASPAYNRNIDSSKSESSGGSKHPNRNGKIYRLAKSHLQPHLDMGKDANEEYTLWIDNSDSSNDSGISSVNVEAVRKGPFEHVARDIRPIEQQVSIMSKLQAMVSK